MLEFFLRLRSSVVTVVAGAGCFRACSWLVLNAKNLIGILFMIAGVRAYVCMRGYCVYDFVGGQGSKHEMNIELH